MTQQVATEGRVSADTPTLTPAHRITWFTPDRPVEGTVYVKPPPTLRCRLELPYDRPPKALVGNTRVHWRRRSADTQQVRTDVLQLAQQAGLHRLGPLKHITAELVWAPGDRRRRDADNLWPLLKVACDALARGPRRDWVGLELVPDDTPEHFTKLAPRIEPPPAKGMWLVLTLELLGEVAS